MHRVAVGGGDAGIISSLGTRALDPPADVAVVVSAACPNFSICGIASFGSGQVTHERNLVRRSLDDLQADGMALRFETK